MDAPADQPAERRSHTKKERIDPKDEDPAQLFAVMGNARFSLAEKTILVAYGTSALTTREHLNMRFDPCPAWPRHKQATDALGELVADVDSIRRGVDPARDPIDEDGVERLREGMKKWTKQLIRHGTIDCEAPHEVGWKVQRNRATLTRMREILLDCWLDDGQKRFYGDTEDAAERNDEFADLFATLDVSHRTLWAQLTTLFPGMYITKQPVKRVRDADETRVRSSHVCVSVLCAVPAICMPCALTLLHANSVTLCAHMQRAARVAMGLEKMKFPAYYQDSKICGNAFNYLFDESQDWRWQPLAFQDCWYIDAFTIDPSAMALELKGIWDRKAGLPPQLQTNFANANIGVPPYTDCTGVLHCNPRHNAAAMLLCNNHAACACVYCKTCRAIGLSVRACPQVSRCALQAHCPRSWCTLCATRIMARARTSCSMAPSMVVRHRPRRTQARCTRTSCSGM